MSTLQQSFADFQTNLFMAFAKTDFGDQPLTLELIQDKVGWSKEAIATFVGDIELPKSRSKITPEERCKARIWGGGNPKAQCSKRCQDGHDFCGNHAAELQDDPQGHTHLWMKCGRIDGPVPDCYSGKTERKPRKSKDNKKEGPKRGRSAYILYSSAKRPEIVAVNPELKAAEVVKLLASSWKELSTEDRQPYEEMASKDKERYLQEKEALQNQEPETPEVVEEEPKTPEVVEEESKTPEVVEEESKTPEDPEDPNNIYMEIRDALNDARARFPAEVEEDDSDSESEEVDAVEWTYRKKKYWLVEANNKVYDYETNEYVGKREGKKLNKDAVDSDQDNK